MFNEEIKEGFIIGEIETKGMRETSRNFFEFTSKYEEIIGKDIAQMSEESSKIIVSEIDFDTMGKPYLIVSIVRSYLRWCVENNIFDNCNEGFLNALRKKSAVEYNTAEKIWFKDPEEFYYSLRKVREFNEGFPEPAILALAWIGLGKNDIYNLLDSQVDIEKRTIFNNDGNIICKWESPEITNILEQYRNCKVAHRENKNATYVVKCDPTCRYFLKKYAPVTSPRFGENYTDVQLTSAMNKISEEYKSAGNPNRMKHSNVWESGRLYELCKLEQAGFDIYSEENKNLVTSVFMGFKSYKWIMESYKNYKRLFNL